METDQLTSNQDSESARIQPQQAGSNRGLFLVVVISILLTAMITGSAVYFWQKSTSEKAISSLEQKINSLEEQVSTMKKVETRFQPAPSPAPSSTSITDPTANWKTYTSDELYFKYPPSWTLDASGLKIVGKDPDVVIYVATKDLTLMNECMRLDLTEKRDNLVVKKYSRVTTGAMCSTEDSTPREIWVIPTENAYSPGISYSYSAEDNPKAENIFNQILSTFRWVD